MFRLMLTPFGMNSNNKFISNFIIGIELSILFILIARNLSKLHQESSTLIILLKIVKINICAVNFVSTVIIKIKNETILEIYDEINLPYSQFYAKSNRKLYSTFIWILAHVITYTSMMFAVSGARISFLSDCEVAQSIVMLKCKHHAAITMFFMNGWPLTMLYIYSELNIRYLDVLDAYWNRLKTIHIKPSYFLVMEIRESMSKLIISENNLKIATNFIFYLILMIIIFLDISIVLYCLCLPELRPSFYLPIVVFLFVHHFVYLSNCLYIWHKSRVQQQIKQKLAGWNY